MLSLKLAPSAEPIRLLCLGAHPDDIEIGCGGTLLRLLAESRQWIVRWVVMSGSDERRAEAEASARRYLRALPDAAWRIELHRFRDGYFPAEIARVKDAFEALHRAFEPDLVLTHARSDLHQDHRAVAELTHNTFRDHLVLEYEIPKYDGDLGNPNLFVPLDAAICERKCAGLVEHFRSQARRRWFTPDTFMALLRLRGIGCNAPSGLAEAFYCRKAVL
ncbi:MAG: PIG-L deacetylase family protein [Stellaceae bacterium]